MNRNRHLSEKNYEKHVQPHMKKECATKKRSNSHHLDSGKDFIQKSTLQKSAESIGSKIKGIFKKKAGK